jgi:hypothetical protein
VLGVPPRHNVAEVDSIGYRCDSETIVASRILGELKTFGTLLGLSMIKVLLWSGE